MLLQFKVQLANITSPPVWRRLIVPGNFSFHRFHLAIQAAFGWEDYHLYQFSEKGYQSEWSVGVPSEDDWREVKNSRKIRISEMFDTKGQHLTYIYDFGDNWVHKIILEEITEGNAKSADCIEGKGACPPEDCGGVWGYEELKEKLSNRKHPEYKELKEWLGLQAKQEWDANYFDIEKAKEAVAEV